MRNFYHYSCLKGAAVGRRGRVRLTCGMDKALGFLVLLLTRHHASRQLLGGPEFIFSLLTCDSCEGESFLMHKIVGNPNPNKIKKHVFLGHIMVILKAFEIVVLISKVYILCKYNRSCNLSTYSLNSNKHYLAIYIHYQVTE